MPEGKRDRPMTDPATSETGRAIRPRRLVTSLIADPSAPETRPTPLAVVLMAVWIGLVTGLLELVLLLVRNYFYGTATLGALQLNLHFPWMIPVTHLIIFGIAGLALAPLAVLRSRRVEW